MWFHLSQSNTDLNQGITELRLPGLNYEDVDKTKPVLSVARTVWQCLLSVSGRKFEKHYIYRIYVTDPTPAEVVNHAIADAHITGEHRITSEVFKANGEFLKTKFWGTLRISKDETLQIFHNATQRNVCPDAEQEHLVLWQIDENGNWTLREHGANIETVWNSLPCNKRAT